MPDVVLSGDENGIAESIRADRGYFGLSESERVVEVNSGETRFQPAADGVHCFLLISGDQAVRVGEVFDALCSEPPHHP